MIDPLVAHNHIINMKKEITPIGIFSDYNEQCRLLMLKNAVLGNCIDELKKYFIGRVYKFYTVDRFTDDITVLIVSRSGMIKRYIPLKDLSKI